MTNPKLEKGDRVVLLQMEGEAEMSFGNRGIVTDVTKVFGHLQYNVKWDNGRILQLLEDADKWMKEEDFDELMRKKRKIKEGFIIKKKDLI